MTDERGTLRSIAWRDLFPWLVIFRTFWLSLSLPLLFLATLGVIAQPIGWRVADLLFIDDSTIQTTPSFANVNEGLSRWPGRPFEPPLGNAQENFSRSSVRELVPPGPGDYASIFDKLSFPFVALFQHRITLNMFCYFLFGGLWTLAIWALVGGAISRVAVVYLGLEERVSARDAVAYTVRRYASYFAAPLYPLLGIMLLAIPIAIIGLLLRFDGGVLVAGLLWIFVLLAALGIAFMAIGLLFGWPLMWPAISAENGDAFEALSRSFGYVFQRPFHYLFYAVISTLFAALCWLFVASFANLIVEMGWWGASWGAGHDDIGNSWVQRIDVVRAICREPIRQANVDSAFWWGTRLLNFWNGLVLAVAWGFGYSLFFCLGSAIYLLLRHVDDETELDEVFLEDDEERFTLPEVKRDAAGVPTMAPTPTAPVTPAPTTPPPSERPLAEEE
jgi:hypothetical protein